LLPSLWLPVAKKKKHLHLLPLLSRQLPLLHLPLQLLQLTHRLLLQHLLTLRALRSNSFCLKKAAFGRLFFCLFLDSPHGSLLGNGLSDREPPGS
jgi:hypothetical protein